MITLDLILQALGMLAGAVILHHVFAACDGMTGGTHHGVRLAYIFMGGGAFGQIVDPWLFSEVAHGADLMLCVSLALLLVFERRCVACPRSVSVALMRRRQDDRPPKGEPI